MIGPITIYTFYAVTLYIAVFQEEIGRGRAHQLRRGIFLFMTLYLSLGTRTFSTFLLLFFNLFIPACIMSPVIETPIATAFQSPTQPNKKISQTTTLCCSPTSLNQKLFSSVESTPRRPSSTPLADRFMSSNNNTSPITVAEHYTQKITREGLNITPDYGRNDQQLFSPPCTTIPLNIPPPPPPLYFLTHDPSSSPKANIQHQRHQCKSSCMDLSLLCLNF